MEKTNSQKLNDSINSCYENLEAFREELRASLLIEQDKLNKIKKEVKQVKEEQIDYVHKKLQELLTFHFKLVDLMDKDGKANDVTRALDLLIKEKLNQVFKTIKQEALNK